MGFISPIRCTATCLLVSSFWAGPADAAEPTALTSASELTLQTASDPVPLLTELARREDWQGLHTEAIRARFHGALSPAVLAEVDYLDALAIRELGDPQRSLAEMERLRGTPGPVGELAELAIAEAWVGILPRQGVGMYQGYLSERPDGLYRDWAAYQATVGLAQDGYFSMALTQAEATGLTLSPEASLMLTDPGRFKRPLVAAALSGGLPGAGQLYARQPQEALSALTVNALFATGMILAARERQWTALGVAGFFGVGFYFGNIYGAADAAIRHNRALRDDVVRSLDPLAPPPPRLPERVPPAPLPPAPIPAAPIPSELSPPAVEPSP
jgi:hypothetical protein